MRIMRYFETLKYARDQRKNPTPAEKFAWDKIRNRKFYGLKFNRQFLIEYKQIMNNRLYYIADFHNFEYKIIIEIDGPIHQLQQEFDQKRQADIEALGYKVIRFTNEEVLCNWENVEKRLLEFIPIPRPLP